MPDRVDGAGVADTNSHGPDHRRLRPSVPPDPNIAAIALAGGRSSRFGSEKAVARLNGVMLIERVAATLSRVSNHVAVSAPASSAAAAFARDRGLTVLEDSPDTASGPLAGVAAGAAWARGMGCDRLLVLSCDTPLVDAEAIAALVAGLGERPGVYLAGDDGAHSLCSLWRTEVAETLNIHAAAGRHPPIRRIFHRHGAAAVPAPAPARLTNINREQDLLVAERLADELRAPTEAAISYTATRT